MVSGTMDSGRYALQGEVAAIKDDTLPKKKRKFKNSRGKRLEWESRLAEF